MKKKRIELNAVGIGIAISDRDEIKFFSSGLSNIQKKIRIDKNAIFDIASIGKLFTSVSTFLLIERGHFTLETNISDLLNGYPKSWDSVKIKHLLTHTSGIKNYTDTKLYWEETQADVSKNRIIEYIINEPLDFKEGTEFRYNNTGFFLLGLIIETVTKKGYFDFIQSDILEKFNLSGIIRTDNKTKNPNKVTGYKHLGDTFKKVEYYSNSGTYSAGGFSARLTDFIKFENLLFTNRIISKSNLNLLLQAYIKPNGKELNVSNADFNFQMGHGLFIFKKDNQKTVAHAGNIKGFSSSYMRFLNDEIAIIISINTDNKFEIHQLLDDIYKTYKESEKDLC